MSCRIAERVDVDGLGRFIEGEVYRIFRGDSVAITNLVKNYPFVALKLFLRFRDAEIGGEFVRQYSQDCRKFISPSVEVSGRIQYMGTFRYSAGALSYADVALLVRDSLRARRGACSAGAGIHSWSEVAGIPNPAHNEEQAIYFLQETNPDGLHIR